MNSEQLARNLYHINQQIKENKAADQNVTLIAVTKTVDIPTMKQLYDLGVRHFAENRVTTFLEKYEALQVYPDIVWHYIGRLQTRQVRSVLPYVDYFHALDRPSLAKEINKRATKPVNCFVQVNVSGESSKAGGSMEATMEWIEDLAQFSQIHIVGLMTMAPIDASDSELHQYFKSLKELQISIAAQKRHHALCHELSMGMSQDYPIAVAEGATFVRVGSALFEAV
ncbi:YggS family pyridoxal phosphate-dependent enzyme [Tuanshanicoccus lijuaniae]|uniref:YggS family pyridoxal phosphate-dependent enzyme n=1 Tax=Aerococcaceae bacterium zg-1292 TaxID=2774330 RepID=UPI001BD8E407|nr:YggS family pyridoxal phosphate-dependent enzyme [Aerococcaceae bacterium zg-A91]MBS4458551.1 YggS family pyridoxal phosphate-dependent enzyme [Aerococcaceae bacterium zg-BR33]